MSIDSLFRDLLVGMEYVEHELVNLVKPGVGYPDLHSDALVKIGNSFLITQSALALWKVFLIMKFPTFSCLTGLAIFLEFRFMI